MTAWLPPVVLALLGWLLLYRQGFFQVDDAYIAFRYAANLAHGHGLVWNPGEPVEGYTNLLWVLLLSPFSVMGLDLVLPAAILSTLAACGCLDLLRRIARTVWPSSSPAMQLLPGLLLATNPSFAYWSAMGMEGPLFAFWAVLSAHLLVLGRQRPQCRWLAGLALAAASLTRPEGPLVAAVFFLVELWGKTRWRDLLGPGLLLVAVLLGHLLFRLHYYGAFLPNTFYAKVVFSTVTLHRGLLHLGGFVVAGGFVLLLGLPALRTRSPLRPYLLQGYLLLAVYGTYLLLVGGDMPYRFRFYLQLMPLPLLGVVQVAADGCRWLTRRAAVLQRLQQGRLRPLVVSLAVLLLISPQALSPCWAHTEIAAIPLVRWQGIKLRGLVNYFFPAHVPPGSYISVNIVGILGYYSDARILDAWGLNDPVIARRKVAVQSLVTFGHDKTDWSYVLGRMPDFIITPFPCPSRKPPPLLGYQICWPTRLVPDILVYRRIFPLSKHQRTLGVPVGHERRLAAPPPCSRPRNRISWPLSPGAGPGS